MKAQYTILGGKLTFALEGQTTKEIFERLADIQEIFEAEHECGLCQAKEFAFSTRQDKDGNTYYGIKCQSCGAEFRFGQRRSDGNLFPKRSGEQGPLPNRGWSRWEPGSNNQGNNQGGRQNNSGNNNSGGNNSGGRQNNSSSSSRSTQQSGDEYDDLDDLNN